MSILKQRTTKTSFSFFEMIEDFQCFEGFPRNSKILEKEDKR